MYREIVKPVRLNGNGESRVNAVSTRSTAPIGNMRAGSPLNSSSTMSARGTGNPARAATMC